MNWKKEVFKNFKLYGVTDFQGHSETLLRKIEEAYRGGTDIIQLRSKILKDNDIIRMGMKIRKIADHYQKLFFVNDRIDLAILLKADGLHLGQEDLPIHFARKISKQMKWPLILGQSTHSRPQILKALEEAPDYLAVGPVFNTPTKPSYAQVGLGLVKWASDRVDIPLVAIGGIDYHNMDQVLRAGAKRIAVVRALFQGDQTNAQAKKLKSKIIQANSQF